MGARLTGKIKTVIYVLAGFVALLAVSVRRLLEENVIFPALKTTAIVIFLVSVVFSVVSFIDYVCIYKKT